MNIFEEAIRWNLSAEVVLGIILSVAQIIISFYFLIISKRVLKIFIKKTKASIKAKRALKATQEELI